MALRPGRWVLLALLTGLVLRSAARCAASPEPFHYEPLGVANGCFVESVACLDAFRETGGQEPWGRVLQWGARDGDVMVAGHAVAILQVADQLWCWDVNFGWSPLALAAAEREDAAALAAPVTARYPRITALYPILWSDGDQGPPPARPRGDASRETDPARVARRLGRHRPVNLVEFTLPGGAEPQQAVIFVFGGRMCLYTAEQGTMLFRARSDVWNIRLVQEMMRRVFPGASAVHSVNAGSAGL